MRFLILLIATLFSSTAMAEQWLCFEEKKSNFSANQHVYNYFYNWSSMQLPAREPKFIISAYSLPDEQGAAHELKMFGYEQPIAPCLIAPDSGYMHCDNGRIYFDMNRRNGRYSYFNPSDYLEGGFNGSAFLSIGRCSIR